jgi:1-acyl-sn-glycerol-3-phosphate acyltransferase
MPDPIPTSGGDSSSSSEAAGPTGGALAGCLGTVCGNLFLVFGTLVCATGAVTTGWIPLPGGGKLFFFWARLWSRLLLVSSGVRWRSEVAVPLDRRQTYVFLANHQSLFDIPVLLATLPVPARFMAKRELFDVPIFGWSLRVGGFIPVDRGAGKGARESFRAAVKMLESGGSVLLFPEETRSPDGRLLPFKRGGFLLASQAGLPIVPVGILGTLNVRQRKSFRIRPGRVVVRYGEPLPAVSGKREGAELVAAVRSRIATLAEAEDSIGSAAVGGDGAGADAPEPGGIVAS